MYLLFHYLTLVVLLVFGTFLSVFFGRMDVLRFGQKRFSSETRLVWIFNKHNIG